MTIDYPSVPRAVQSQSAPISKTTRHGISTQGKRLRAMSVPPLEPRPPSLQCFVSIRPQRLERRIKPTDYAVQTEVVPTSDKSTWPLGITRSSRRGHICRQCRASNHGATPNFAREETDTFLRRVPIKDPFGKQLANHARGARTERSADRKFRGRGRWAREHKQLRRLAHSIRTAQN